MGETGNSPQPNNEFVSRGYPVTIETGGDANTEDDELTLAVTSFEEGRYRKGHWVTY